MNQQDCLELAEWLVEEGWVNVSMADGLEMVFVEELVEWFRLRERG